MKTSRVLMLALGLIASALSFAPKSANAQDAMSDFEQSVQIHNKGGDTFFINRKGDTLTAYRSNSLTGAISPVGVSSVSEFAALSHELASKVYERQNTVGNRALNGLAVLGISSLALSFGPHGFHDVNLATVLATYAAAWGGATRLCSYFNNSERSCYTNVADVAKDLEAGKGGNRLDIWVTSDDAVNVIMAQTFKRPASKSNLRLISNH